MATLYNAFHADSVEFQEQTATKSGMPIVPLTYEGRKVVVQTPRMRLPFTFGAGRVAAPADSR